jgi:VCBS repeat-containing protein
LNRYANIVNADARSWTRGRYTITVEVQSIDGTSANVSVNAKIEGRTDGATGAEWITLQSTGTAEQEFLSALIENVTGSAPGPRP